MTQAGDRPMADIQRLRGAVETMGTYGQALFYQAWRYCQPDDPDLARLLDRIRGRAVSQATSAGDAQLSWNGPSPQVSFWSAGTATGSQRYWPSEITSGSMFGALFQ